MIQKKGTPIGTTDQLFHEICVGDEIRDAKGVLYTVNGYGYADPLLGGSAVPVKSIKGCEVVRVWKPSPAPAPKPVAESHLDAPPPAPEKEAPKLHPPRQGGKKNLSGLVAVQNLTRYRTMKVSEAVKILNDGGIEVAHDHLGKSVIRLSDKPRAVELLGPTVQNGQRLRKAPGHRPNKSGVVCFKNMARPLGVDGAVLRALAEDHGFEIVVPEGLRDSGVRVEDAPRFRELVKEKIQRVPQPAPFELTDDAVVKEVQERALWLRCLEECDGFSDTLLHNILVKRGFYGAVPGTPELEKALATTDPAQVFTKEDAYILLDDQDLADFLRRRGYEVCAVKHVQL